MNRLITLVTALVLLCSEVHAGNPPETSDDYIRELMRFSGITASGIPYILNQSW